MAKAYLKNIVFTFAIIIIISSCGVGDSKTNTYYDDNYHSGTEGLDIRFVDQNPPYQIYAPGGISQDDYNIMIEIKNRGAYTTSQNHFVLSGYDSNIFDIYPSYFRVLQNPSIIEGRSAENPAGGFNTLTWTIRSTTLPEGLDQFNQKFMVNVCYDYQTDASIAVCVDPRPFEYTSREKICRPDVVKVGGGQGAPVAVTNIEITPMTNKVQMKIEVQNVGIGRVVDWSVPLEQIESACPFNLNYQDLNKIAIAQIRLGGINGINGRCTPDQILLVNNRASIYCTFENINVDGRDDAYMSTLDIKLLYKYTASIQRDMNVKSVPG